MFRINTIDLSHVEVNTNICKIKALLSHTIATVKRVAETPNNP